MRPIDADKLVECINTVQEWALAIGGQLEAIEPVNEGFISLINSMPAVEAEPVRHGKWIYGEHEIAMCDGYRCSKCGYFVPWDYGHKSIDYINEYHYCPSCGAKMDEVKEE